MKYGLSLDLNVRGHHGLADGVNDIVDAFATLEASTPDLLDLAIGSDELASTVHVEITVEAPTPEDALGLGLSCLRSAIHIAGGATPDWDERPPDAVTCFYLDSEGIQTRPLVGS